jgi:hypothetical protein
MRITTQSWGVVAGVLFAVLLGAAYTVGAESYDYQDYRDAGYFDDGFSADDWFYDWYDTGFYEGGAQKDWSTYYDTTDEKTVFEF